MYEDSNVQYMDLNRVWPWPNESIDVVYGSHVFEHLRLASAKLFLDEAKRVLRSRGVIRIVVPDLYKLAKRYVTDLEAGEQDASTPFLDALNLHLENSVPASQKALSRCVHFAQGHPHQHKYMYDMATMVSKLAAVGFREMTESAYGVSRLIPEIDQVEHTREGVPSLYVEATKP
jgi:predicted SAM-dependent methyltransferase